MAAFDDAQIKRFIKNWFRKPRDIETETAQRCWKLLSSKDYQSAKELAQTPLLSTLLCVVYDEYQDFPKKRHALYGEALDVLLRKWASEKRVQHDPIYKELSTELELYLLSEIAYTNFINGQLFFSQLVLVEQIRDFLVDNLNAPDHLDAEKVLKEIEIQQGILVERARDTYSFSHLTFQEYLTAKYIVDNKKIDVLVREHINDERWREVFLLVTGLVSGKQDANKLLLAMEQQAQTYLNSKTLIALVDWATRIANASPNSIQPSALRSYALVSALNHAITNDRALRYTLAKNRGLKQSLVSNRASASVCALDRALALALTLDSTNNLEYELAQALDHASVLDLASVLNSDHASAFDLASILDHASNLASYCYVLELMVHCKEAAVQVSLKVCSDIDSRMVTKPNKIGLTLSTLFEKLLKRF